MSEILNELQEVKKASQEQTAASQAQTAEVAGKMAQIDQKVNEATAAVPDAIVAMASQEFYIDAENGSDSNDGLSSSKPVQNASALEGRVVSGSYVNLLFRANQSHTVNFFMNNGYIRIGNYGGGSSNESWPKLYPKVVLTGGQHKTYGLGLYSGTIFCAQVKLMCDSQGMFDSTTRYSANGFISYSESNVCVVTYFAEVHLIDMPYSAAHSGYSSRDFYFSSVTIDKTNCTADGVILKNINSTENTFRLDVYSVSLVGVPGGWAELMPETTEKLNMFTNATF